MSAASYTGTTSSPPRGHSFVQDQACTVEPAGGLTVTVTVQPGSAVERIAVDSTDEPVSGSSWRKFDEGESFEVGEGQRVLLRPRGGGGGGVTFAWHGAERLAALAAYGGRRGESDYSVPYIIPEDS